MLVRVLAGLVVRLTGIYLLLSTGTSAITIYAQIMEGSGLADYLALAVTVVVSLAVSLAMIVFPGTIAIKLVEDGAKAGKSQALRAQIAKEEKREEKEQMSHEDVEHLASSVIGLFFLAQSIIDGFYLLGYVLGMRAYGLPLVWPKEYMSMIFAIPVEFIAALWFLFGAKGLWAMVRWARKVGTDKRGL